MTAESGWTIEELASSEPDGFADADLDLLEPLWRSLMDSHSAAWTSVPMRRYEDSWPRRRAQYHDWLSATGSFVLVAQRESQLLGYAVIGIHDGDETYATGECQAEIHTLAVLPEERDRGLGTALMEDIERRLLANGVTDVFVATMYGNDAAQRFYERRGYTPFVRVNYRKLTVD